MERERLSVELDNVDWVDTGQKPEQPRLMINFDGPEEALTDRFRELNDPGYTPDELDLFYRFRPSDHPAVTGGIFSVTDRATGGYLIEIDVDPDFIEELVHAVRQYSPTSGEKTRYTVVLQIQNRQIAEIEKEILLIYGSDGTLLRPRSLIPDGIEV